ncbi:38K [Parapoynx stagnalis nucleopolyhedrovirus]|uniref:38K n=1 Tax=Parapoynx stagnalis nucleopolyhedrovirus TaxID=2993413 RepID=A0A9E7Y6V9_9ABAC|nr:38K [Parapoynx stagnalis nucleopolyhedrovirus]
MASLRCNWICLRLNNTIIKRHVLVLREYSDLKYLGFENYKYFEYVIFAFSKDPMLLNIIQNNSQYCLQLFTCADDMRDIRYYIKRSFKVQALGHFCIINALAPMYSFLKEWFIVPFEKIVYLKNKHLIWDFPHVIVFDLDSTLITEEEHVRIRDPQIYDSLSELKDMGCVLILWSYGSREHVAHSLKQVNLDSYFDIVISEGSTLDTNEHKTANRQTKNLKLKKLYVEKDFKYDLNDDVVDIPKTPKIVIKYLAEKNINCFKTITLVDDLATNNFSYDYFIKVSRCPVPKHDWHQYHEEILENINYC